jgi:hypothetical protein
VPAKMHVFAGSDKDAAGLSSNAVIPGKKGKNL